MQTNRKAGRPAGSVSRYSILAEKLRQRLKAGEWSPGTAMPSCRQIATKYNVGYHVARLALKALATEGRLRIMPNQASVAELGASLHALLKDTFVVVLPQHFKGGLHPACRTALWGSIELGVGQSMCPLLVLRDEGRESHEFLAGINEVPARGVLMIGPFAPSLLQDFENCNVPVVLIDPSAETYTLHSVVISNNEAAFDATSRLIASGHRRIAFVGGTGQDSKEQEAGFVAACEKARFKNSQFRSFITSARGSAGELLDKKPRFTAVLTSNIDAAEQVAASAAVHRIRIPGALSIVTFHSSGESGRNWTGPRIDFAEVGRAAIEILKRKQTGIERVRIRPLWHQGETFHAMFKE